jgi:hypothetical protein
MSASSAAARPHRQPRSVSWFTKDGKFCIIAKTRINKGLAMLQMSSAKKDAWILINLERSHPPDTSMKLTAEQKEAAPTPKSLNAIRGSRPIAD